MPSAQDLELTRTVCREIQTLVATPVAGILAERTLHTAAAQAAAPPPLRRQEVEEECTGQPGNCLGLGRTPGEEVVGDWLETAELVWMETRLRRDWGPGALKTIDRANGADSIIDVEV